VTSESITARMREGYTFICATCPHLHRSKDQGLETCFGNMNGKTCCGPMAGGCYPEYVGPLKGSMTSRCFLTGAESIGAVDIRGVLIGVSEKAIDVLSRYSPRGGTAPPMITRKHLPVVC
jgi:hypothetical protein